MEHLTAAGAPEARGAYSHGVVAGELLFTAGMGPLDPVTGEVIGSTVAEQTARVIANLTEILRLRGRGLQDVVKATVHLADLGTFAEFDAAYRQLMPQPYPVRTTVGSTLPGILVEIDFVALA
ncbi:MAG TPA: Rid family hydrolase [Streptosporangiaceae bacterium]|nr:Rid family hydrolase [Streptosporangiaceae bacterium]